MAIIPSLLLCGRDIKGGSGCITFAMPRGGKQGVAAAMEQLAGMAPIDLWLNAMAAKAKEKGELDDHWGRVDKPHTPPARAVSQKREEPSPLTKAPEVDAADADMPAKKKDRNDEVVGAAAAASARGKALEAPPD